MSIEPNPRRSQQSAASEHRDVHRHLPATVVCVMIIFAVMTGRWVSAAPSESDPQPEPAPTLDRLATPVMPNAPTQIDIGRREYYDHCMPCHGDRGQGLTDEWRAVWVEDHQNCWASRCHGGRANDEGFPIPSIIPAIFGSPQALARFPTADELLDYLRRTHPLQEPGRLSDDEYGAVTAYLLNEVGRHAADDRGAPLAGLAALAGGLALTTLIALRVRRWRADR